MIGRDTIDQIRARTDIVALIGESVKLQRRGRSHVGLCPFHQEKTASFNVNEERGFFYCHGCKVSGDCFKFVELSEGLSFMEVVRKLAERAGVEIVDDRSDPDRAADARARKAKDDLYGINAMAAAFFERMLVEHPLAGLACDELEKRGLAYDGPANEVLRSFRVGYAPHGWDGLVGFLKQQGVSPAQAEEVGLLAARTSGSGFYDAFRHRLRVAITDVQGRVVAFSGRVLPPPPSQGAQPAEDKGSAPPKYVNSRESSIYSKGSTLFGLFQGRNGIRARSEAVLVEGNFDLIAMHARGLDHAVAPMGTAFTPDQAKLLRRFAPAVVLLFDADAAGKKATWAARDVCREVGISARAAKLPQGKDPDEFLRAKGPEAMWNVLKAARALDEVLVDDLCDPVGEGSNLAAKQTALLKIRPLLEDQELTFREVLAKRVAARLGLDTGTLWRLISGGSAEQVSGAPTRVAAGPEEDLSRAIVEALLSVPEVLDDPTIQDSLALVAGDWAFAVVALRQEMRNSRRENRHIDATALLAQLPASIQEFAAAKLVAPGLDPTTASNGADPSTPGWAATEGRPDPLLVRRVIRETAVKLEKAAATARYREIEREIERAEATADPLN
jgi:DNA primase